MWWGHEPEWVMMWTEKIIIIITYYGFTMSLSQW